METDKTNYQEYTKDNEIHDLKSIISSLETKIENLEKQFAISGVIESSFIEVFDKAACIQHWHNTGENDEGMVVSSDKVHELWEVLEKYRDYRHSL